eukprot:NODE_1659_length_1090_cov_613.771014.p1 GENE.NODE_1659_length_1090_cov_613.771014~~NODE_1659_length_1090_cov_613.771014.p1  ORF type:complete len:323 (+),score=125.84 NODE_1659_length_1090_cov_613.771014:3-971(+)
MGSRGMVTVAYKLHSRAREGELLTVTNKDVDELATSLGANLSGKARAELRQGLNELMDECSARGATFADSDIVRYLKRLAPSSEQRHLRLYLVWVQEFDKVREQQSDAVDIKAAMVEFEKNQRLPMIPAAALTELQDQFDRLDTSGNGLVTMEEIVAGWELSRSEANEMFAGFDETRDSFIDQQEFVRIACPKGYRPPDMDGTVRAAFGEILRSAAQVASEADGGPAALPATLLPLATEKDMEDYNDIFNDLDRNHDDTVDVRELEVSGIVSTCVCYALAKIIDPKSQDGFSREGFLVAMCHVNGLRPPNYLVAAELERVQG